METSIRLGKILGIPIGINYSWIVVFLLFSYMLFDLFGQEYPSWPILQRWSLAVATTVLLFFSVLAHELSHSVVAVRKGIPVRGITLFIFGGVSQLAHEARRPFTEFLVAVVGPLTSVVLALVCGGLWYLSQGTADSLSAIFSTLLGINLGLAVLNMLPGFPLDGGRVLRAVVWGATGSYWRATLVATRAGQVIGTSLVIGGLSLAIFVTGFQSLWMALIGGFLLAAATTNYRQERARKSLKSYRVTDIMTTDWYQLPGVTPLDSLLVAQGLSSRADFLVVLAEGQMKGILTRRLLARVPRNAWPDTPLAEVMLPLSSVPSLSPEDEISSVLEQMESESLGLLAVRRDGMLLGFISREDARRLMRTHLRSGH